MTKKNLLKSAMSRTTSKAFKRPEASPPPAPEPDPAAAARFIEGTTKKVRAERGRYSVYLHSDVHDRLFKHWANQTRPRRTMSQLVEEMVVNALDARNG